MAKQITCECGYVARADGERRRDREDPGAHALGPPELLDKVSREDLAGWIEEV